MDTLKKLMDLLFLVTMLLYVVPVSYTHLTLPTN